MSCIFTWQIVLSINSKKQALKIVLRATELKNQLEVWIFLDWEALIELVEKSEQFRGNHLLQHFYYFIAYKQYTILHQNSQFFYIKIFIHT